MLSTSIDPNETRPARFLPRSRSRASRSLVTLYSIGRRSSHVPTTGSSVARTAEKTGNVRTSAVTGWLYLRAALSPSLFARDPFSASRRCQFTAMARHIIRHDVVQLYGGDHPRDAHEDDDLRSAEIGRNRNDVYTQWYSRTTYGGVETM